MARNLRRTLKYDSTTGTACEQSAREAADGPLYMVGGETEVFSELQVVVDVIKAELFPRSEQIGRRETYAIVDWVSAHGVKVQIARTQPDRDGHSTPEWFYSCRGQPYAGSGNGDRIKVGVFEQGDSGTVAAQPCQDLCCGHSSILIDDLLSGLKFAGVDASNVASKPEDLANKCNDRGKGPVCELTLDLDGRKTGTVALQASLVTLQATAVVPRLTRVDPSMFRQPVTRVGISGGTAPFFRLKLITALGDRSCNYYIGKDLSHATDEVLFYEQARVALATEIGFAPILKFTLEYAGIVSCEVEGESSLDKQKDLLVLRNLYDGCSSLRLIDLKIGQKTGAAGWQGKSRVAALRQALVDGVTNSVCEGFRLEGFEGVPESVKTMNPLIDVGGGREKVMKRAFRIMLQRMSGAEIFMHFIDVHQMPKHPRGNYSPDEFLTPVELAELVLREIACRLAALAVACRHVPVPQKWIGSSVALAFDCGQLPIRALPEQRICEMVKVHVFDWGRSELNTPENHNRLTAQEQKSRSEFWTYYVGGIDRLAWEAARAYWNRFSSTDGWKEVCLTLFDFDSHSENDFIGRVLLCPLKESPERTVPLLDAYGHEVRASRGGPVAALTFSVEFHRLPMGSRLQGAWRVCIVRAQDLPTCNWTYGSTDAFVEMTATCMQRCRRFRQVSSVKANTLQPEWNETLELPQAATPGLLEVGLSASCHGLGAPPLWPMFPCEELILNRIGNPATLRGPDDASGFAQWSGRLEASVRPRRAHPAMVQDPSRRVTGHSVSLIEHGSLPTRLVAYLGALLSCLLSFLWLLNPLAAWAARADTVAYIIAALELPLTAATLLFEVPQHCILRYRCLDRCQDLFIAFSGCLAKAFSRGLAHLLQGTLWISGWVYLLCMPAGETLRPPWHLMLPIGLVQLFIGVLHLAIHFGIMSTKIVRKAHL